ncbi:hypothetical protein JVW21_20615, partial [Vibrio cholerae O1]|uniref:hypothetical protein n=1 Tax=Vibrio cholerae TaxID=666 RepID=UPI001C1001D1
FYLFSLPLPPRILLCLRSPKVVLSFSIEEEICMLICADKRHNLKTIHEELRKSGESVWNAFSRGKEKQEWVL